MRRVLEEAGILKTRTAVLVRTLHIANFQDFTIFTLIHFRFFETIFSVLFCIFLLSGVGRFDPAAVPGLG